MYLIIQYVYGLLLKSIHFSMSHHQLYVTTQSADPLVSLSRYSAFVVFTEVVEGQLLSWLEGERASVDLITF